MAFETLERELQEPTSLDELRTKALLVGRGQLDCDERVFYHLQTLLTAAANVSKFLWSTRTVATAARAGALRKLLDLPERLQDSVVGRRDIRNSFEHFDERLDEVLRQGVLADKKLVSSNEPGTWDSVAKTCLRIFTVTDRVAMFGEVELPLTPLVDELQRLAARATELSQTPFTTR